MLAKPYRHFDSPEEGGDRKVKWLDRIAMILVIVGALNWGLVGLANIDLVALICGAMSILSRIVYILVGLSAIWVAVKSPALLK
jgi:hypothetical protein